MTTITATPERMLSAAISRLRVANGGRTERLDLYEIAVQIAWHCQNEEKERFPEFITVGGEIAQRLAPTLMEIELEHDEVRRDD